MVLFRSQVLLLPLFIASWEALTFVTSTEPSTEPSMNDYVPFKTEVFIHNNLDDGLPLTVHCKSKDDDLGIHVIPNHTPYRWNFRVNFWQTTLYFCGFNWQGGSGTFDIYRADRDLTDRCSRECHWTATRDGLHGFKQGSGHDDLFYRWVTPQSDTKNIQED